MELVIPVIVVLCIVFVGSMISMAIDLHHISEMTEEFLKKYQEEENNGTIN